MARAKVKDGILRGCPTCGSKVDTVDLGLRDFRWLNESLPGKVGAMDLDCVLTQWKTGRMLVIETKPKGVYIPTGERLTFSTLVKAGYDVWIVWDQNDGNVMVGPCNDKGLPFQRELMSVSDAAAMVAAWWSEGVDDD